MRPQRNRITSFILCFSILFSGSIGRAQSGDGKQAKQVLEGYVTVVSKVYPPAGGVFGAMLKMLDFTGYFGKTADPVGEALKAINTRLDEHARQIAQLERDLADLRQEVRGEQNWNRFNRLRDSRGALKTITDRLARRPTDVDTKIELAGDAREVAERFLDLEMWRWSDRSKMDQSWKNRFGQVETFKTGEMTDLDFKAMPTLEYYTTAIVVWAATLEHASGGDAAAIRQQHGSELQKHIAFLTKRPGWKDDGSDPVTLPEQVMVRVSGEHNVGARYAEKGECYYYQSIRDDMRRSVSTGEFRTYAEDRRLELCNVPGATQRSTPDMEIAREREYGLDVMTNLASLLTNLRDKGTVRGAVMISPSTTSSTPAKPSPEPAFQGRFDTGGGADEFQTLYTVSQDGTLTWRRHYIRYPNGRNNFPTHTFSEPKTVGSGWAGGHRDVMAMGQLGIYSLLEDGTLRWNWHLGFNDGSFKWSDPLELSKGMTGFKQLVAQDEGIIYGIMADGSIVWGVTANYDKKKGTPSTSFPIVMRPVNINFNAFTRVFGGGKGVFYGVDRAGKLYWMKHNFYRSPMPEPTIKIPGSAEYAVWMNQWSGPIEIGGGLGTPENAFSPGDGHIYYSFLGQLFWDRHVGWENGTKKWGRGAWTTITGTSNWGNYKFAFARNTTSDLGSGNPLLEIIVR